jgi:hypothetical protein
MYSNYVLCDLYQLSISEPALAPAQRRSEHELTDCACESVHNIQHFLSVMNIGYAPHEEGVEGEARDGYAVYKLDDAGGRGR